MPMPIADGNNEQNIPTTSAAPMPTLQTVNLLPNTVQATTTPPQVPLQPPPATGQASQVTGLSLQVA